MAKENRNLRSPISCSSIYNNFNNVIKMYLTLIATLSGWGSMVHFLLPILRQQIIEQIVRTSVALANSTAGKLSVRKTYKNIL